MRDGEEIKPRKLHEIGVWRKEKDGTYTEESLATRRLRDAFRLGNKIHENQSQIERGHYVVFCRHCGSRNYIGSTAGRLWRYYEDSYSGRPPGCQGCDRD
jgi:hypothetical protein